MGLYVLATRVSAFGLRRYVCDSETCDSIGQENQKWACGVEMCSASVAVSVSALHLEIRFSAFRINLRKLGWGMA